MSFLDAIFGRTKPAKSRVEPLFSLVTAQVTMEERLELRPAGRAGLCFRSLGTAEFHEAERQLNDLIAASGRETQSQIETREDEFGYRWLVLADPDFEDLVSLVYTASQELQAQGFGPQLLAAAFRFDPVATPGRPFYWIYNFRRGVYSPFAPFGEGKRRDNALELRTNSIMSGELPTESRPDQWYALWGIPV